MYNPLQNICRGLNGHAPCFGRTQHLKSNEEVEEGPAQRELLGNHPLPTLPPCSVCPFVSMGMAGVPSGNTNASSSAAAFHTTLHVFLIYSAHCGVEVT